MTVAILKGKDGDEIVAHLEGGRGGGWDPLHV